MITPEIIKMAMLAILANVTAIFIMIALVVMSILNLGV